MAKAQVTDVTNVPTTVDQSTGEIVAAGTMPKLVIKRRVTTPLFKMRVGLPVAFIFLTAITEGKKIEKSKYDGVPHLAHVFNAEGKSYKICDLQEFEIPEGLELPKA